MKNLFAMVTLAILLVGSVLLGLSDMDTSVADAGIPDNEVASSVGNSSAGATITITMYAVADE